MTRLEAYEVLGLSVGAVSEQVLAAHRQLVRLWHPDLFPLGVERDAAEEKLKAINAARDRLLEVWIEPPVEEVQPSEPVPETVEPAPDLEDDMEGVFVVPVEKEVLNTRGMEIFWITIAGIFLTVLLIAVLLPEEEGSTRGNYYDRPSGNYLAPDAPTLFHRGRILFSDEVR